MLVDGFLDAVIEILAHVFSNVLDIIFRTPSIDADADADVDADLDVSVGDISIDISF